MSRASLTSNTTIVPTRLATSVCPALRTIRHCAILSPGIIDSIPPTLTSKERLLFKQGKIVNWNDEKGFGFIEPALGGRQVFVHIRAFPRGASRPVVGASVQYQESLDDQGRLNAGKARFPQTGTPLNATLQACLISFSFLAAIGIGVAMGLLSQPVLWLYSIMSLLTYGSYAMDKAAAKKSARRTPENTLHLMALLGGWPGALVAQQYFRHKTSKQPFRMIFWITLGLNVAGLVVLVSDSGARVVKQLGVMMIG